jgi:hypothetical protein
MKLRTKENQTMNDEIKASVVMLTSGESVITILREVFDKAEDDEDGPRKGICLEMNFPYSLEVFENEDDVQVKFSKWCPYSDDVSFRTAYGNVISVATASSGLEEAYKQKIQEVQSILLAKQEQESQKETVPVDADAELASV